MEPHLIIESVQSIIRRHLPPEYKVFLFGSWARGNADERSDVDIGILGERQVPWEAMTLILQEVDALSTLRSVDIVDLLATDDRFRSAAIANGKLLQ